MVNPIPCIDCTVTTTNFDSVGSVRMTLSATGLCHTFDAKADGYMKSEAINCLILKRLDTALRDGDPIRAVIRGCSNGHNGHTHGISTPSGEQQAATTLSAYRNANISEFGKMIYLECHGTGTSAGDPTEVLGASQVFASSRAKEKPLILGSVGAHDTKLYEQCLITGLDRSNRTSATRKRQQASRG